MRRVGNILKGNTPWVAIIDGQDIVVRGVLATCFGGGHDQGDNGETESGIPNDGRNPHLLGVALPIRSIEAATAGSPLAFPGLHIPWESEVRVWRDADGEDTAIVTQLIDNGPNDRKYPTHGLDMTVSAAHHFAPHIPVELLANSWEGEGFSYRIKGAARYAPSC
ncbi:MAG: hypothetical protein P4L99_28195 [Chthoniobacter sp.]|nr:hypothetical protein [Chthoniobacter sp.]